VRKEENMINYSAYNLNACECMKVRKVYGEEFLTTKICCEFILILIHKKNETSWK
jgi:hypothetical protein